MGGMNQRTHCVRRGAQAETDYRTSVHRDGHRPEDISGNTETDIDQRTSVGTQRLIETRGHQWGHIDGHRPEDISGDTETDKDQRTSVGTQRLT